MSELLSEPKLFIEPGDLQESLHFTEANIQGAIIEQASLFAYYAKISSDAMIQADKFKNRVEILESRIAQEIRDEAAESGKKVTEAAIKQQISGDPRYVKAQLNYSKAKAQADYCKNALEAFKQRKDMIIQIGVAQRQERERKAFVSETASRVGVSKTAIENG